MLAALLLWLAVCWLLLGAFTTLSVIDWRAWTIHTRHLPFGTFGTIVASVALVGLVLVIWPLYLWVYLRAESNQSPRRRK